MSENGPISQEGALLWHASGQLVQTWPQKPQVATTAHARTAPAVTDVKDSTAAGLEHIQQVS